MKLALVLFVFCATLAAQPTLDEILRRVAENQEKSIEGRKTIVYRQDSWTRLTRGNGKLAREEKRQYDVLPTPEGTEKKLVKFEGQYEKGGKLYPYDKPEFRQKDMDIDGDIVVDLTDDLVNDKESRDGISQDLFPLTSAEQKHYRFKLEGKRKIQGVDAWRITYEPKRNAKGDHDDEIEDDSRPWSGEALIHPDDFQPLLVTTKLALNIPGWVKVVFGISIKQLGFSVTYQKVDDRLWFPATFGTEFYIRVFFGYARNVAINVTNRDFRKATAESTITFQDKQPPP